MSTLHKKIWLFLLFFILGSWPAKSEIGFESIPEIGGHVLFYASFEKTADADFARGDRTPIKTSNLQYAEGEKGSGIRIQGDAVCVFPAKGNFNPSKGTVMMWVKRGSGSDALLTIGKKWYGETFFTIRAVEGQNNTHSAMKQDNNRIFDLNTKVVMPQEEWHHYAVTWGEGKSFLYVDGKEVASSSMEQAVRNEGWENEMWLGSSGDGRFQANSIIDELYILDIPLKPEQIMLLSNPDAISSMRERDEKRKQAAIELKKLFYATFDNKENPFRADISAGNAEPAIKEGIKLVPGIRGNGVLLEGQDILAYESAGNIDKDLGSIEFWFKPQFDRETISGYPTFFKEDAPLGPLPTNNLWLFIERGRMRYDLRVKGDDSLYAAIPSGLQNIWYHVVMTWDSERGSELFINGRRAPSFVSDKPYGSKAVLAWTPKEHPRFFIGSRGRDTYHTQSPLWGACYSVIDEFSIYNRPLSDTEVEQKYFAIFGKENIPPYMLLRRAAVMENTEYRPIVDMKNPHRFDMNGHLEVLIRQNGKDDIPLISRNVRIPAGSENSVQGENLRLGQGQYQVVFFYNGRQADVETLLVLSPVKQQKGDTQPRLIASCNAVDFKEKKKNYRESKPATVKKLAEKSYIEAGNELFSRIAFRFNVENPGKPHILRVIYPDNAERVFDIIVNSPKFPCTYDTQGGVLTGRELENTGTFQKYDMLYWPRETDQALILTTWAEGMPAAIQSFEVYELPETLPSLFERRIPLNSGRRLGLYWEDPMLSQCFGGRPNEKNSTAFLEQTVDRMVNYMQRTGQNTLIYPSVFYQGPGFKALSENFITGSGYDRHPDRYIDIILARFEEAGFGYLMEINGALSSEILSPLQEYMEKPEEGYLAVDKQGKRHTGMFPRLNPLHPVYQEKMLEMFREICRQFGQSPAFLGIQLHIVFESSFWFGSIDWGYDDFTMSLFSKETGINIPTFAEESRYKQRYEWLMQKHEATWTSWRCRKLREFYGRLAEVLSSTRKDLKLIIGLRYLAEGSTYLPHWEQAGRSMRTLYKGAGIDMELMHEIPNVEVQKYFYPADIKWKRMQDRSNTMYAGLELRRSSELRETLTLNGEKAVSTNLYINYFETNIGERDPIPNFWWQCPRWRVVGPSPGGRNFLEMFAESVASYDAPMITTGGFVVGTMGNDEQTREFASAFIPLPNGKFETVPGFSDTAVVRMAPGGYLYAVSRSPFPVTITLQGEAALKLKDISDNSEVNGRKIKISLMPYQMRTFKGALETGSIAIIDYNVPEERKDMVIQTINTLKAKGTDGFAIALRIEKELEKLNYVQCKYIMEEPRTLDLLYGKKD